MTLPVLECIQMEISEAHVCQVYVELIPDKLINSINISQVVGSWRN